jgi:GT2 family glycosyltransferase
VPLVAVLCPLYNHQAFIADTVASVQAQTLTNWQMMVVDDASTDGSAAVVQALAAQDERITLIGHADNQGISLALHTAWQQAQAPYIAMLGSDDRFMCDKLALQLAYLQQHPEVGAVYGQAQAIDELGQVLNQPGNPTMALFNATPMSRIERLQRFFNQGNHLVGSSIMVRQSVLQAMAQPFNPQFHQLEDYDRNFKLALQTELAVLPDPLVQYRQHPGNVSKRATFTDLRTRWETTQILLDVAHQMQPADALAAFAPTHQNGSPVSQLHPLDVPYVLAQAALNTGKAAHRLFALQALAQGMGQPATYRQWQDTFGFTVSQYHQLTGLFDFFEYEKSRPVAKTKLNWQIPLPQRYTARFSLLRQPPTPKADV